MVLVFPVADLLKKHLFCNGFDVPGGADLLKTICFVMVLVSLDADLLRKHLFCNGFSVPGGGFVEKAFVL